MHGWKVLLLWSVGCCMWGSGGAQLIYHNFRFVVLDKSDYGIDASIIDILGLQNPWSMQILTRPSFYYLDKTGILLSRQTPVRPYLIDSDILVYQLYGDQVEFSSDSINATDLVFKGGDSARIYLSRAIISHVCIHDTTHRIRQLMSKVGLNNDTTHRIRTFISELRLNESKIHFLEMDDVSFPATIGNNFNTYAAVIDTINISNATIASNLVFEETQVKYFSIHSLTFDDAASGLDLTRLKFDPKSATCGLNLYDVENTLAQIKLNYENFSLTWEPAYPVTQKERIYRQLLSNQQRDGFVLGYKKLDKEYRQFKYEQTGWVGYLQNIIDRWWWDYGYDKFRVISNSIKLFGIFLVLNLFLYSGLKKVYYPSKFKEYDNRLDWDVANKGGRTRLVRPLARIPIIFVYTAYVFWGLKLDLKELELRKPAYFIILILEYVIGIVCLAYIANYIISK